MDKDYLQEALSTFNGGNWYGWKKKMIMLILKKQTKKLKKHQANKN